MNQFFCVVFIHAAAVYGVFFHGIKYMLLHEKTYRFVQVRTVPSFTASSLPGNREMNDRFCTLAIWLLSTH